MANAFGGDETTNYLMERHRERKMLQQIADRCEALGKQVKAVRDQLNSLTGVTDDTTTDYVDSKGDEFTPIK